MEPEINRFADIYENLSAATAQLIIQHDDTNNIDNYGVCGSCGISDAQKWIHNQSYHTKMADLLICVPNAC